MHAELNAQLAFHVTGARSPAALEPLEGLGLRPALLARYRDLTALRYDFPLVFGRDGVRSLSSLVDEALAGVSDERVRAQALRREREIRARVAGGLGGKLSALWNLQPALALDGELADCDANLPAKFVSAAWAGAQAAKARRFHDEVERLVVQLSGILAADFVQSDEGRSADALAKSLAARDESFDTQAMARLLAKALPERRLPRTRQRRIRGLVSALKNQRLFAARDGGAKPFPLAFYSSAAALEALRERRGQTIELARAVAAARLEAAGSYVEAEHDALLEEFAENAIAADLIPDTLVCLNARNLEVPAEKAALAELLASGLPLKVLVQHDDILGRSPVGNAPAFGAQARLIAGMALGLNDVFVLQTSASNLYALRSRVVKGLEYPGVALFSVFSGVTPSSPGIATYLVAAAAMQSRAFPAFSYDPSADTARFSVENNPQPESDWPVQGFEYEDAEHQRVREELAFTLADFAACDGRYARFFARVPLKGGNGAAGSDVPSLLMVDKENLLQRVIVAEPLARESRRCLDAWKSLRSLVWRPAPAPVAVPEQKQVEEKPAAPAAAAPASDAAYIETPRCTTCEECVKINARMFVYDGNKQAYITDPKLGSYRELVEAAESCQVSIIHPGKPLNPDEPGLAELVERAQPFL